MVKRGVSQGSHWAWVGTPSLAQSDTGQLHPWGSTRTSRTPRVIESSCSTWGRDGNSCWSSELVVSLKTTTLITVCWLRLLRLLFIHAAVVYRVVDGKESKTECGIILCALPLEIEVCERNVLLDSECTQHSCIPKSEAPVLVDLMTKSAENWWFNRLRQWFFFCAPLLVSLFIAVRLSSLKP